MTTAPPPSRPGWATPGERTSRARRGPTRDPSAPGRASRRRPVLAEELVRPQVERGTDVRTAVDVRAVAAVMIHDEAVHGAPGALESKRCAVTGRHRRGGAAPLVGARHGPDGIIPAYARDRRA